MFLKLKALLVEKGMKQSEMAELIGIDNSSFNSKINGNRQFKKDEIDKIIQILELPYEVIFFKNELRNASNKAS